MDRFFETYAKVIGLIVLAFVVIILLSTPSTIFAQAITTIGTELSRATGDETVVRTKVDFGNNEHMRVFAEQIGAWSGYEYNTTQMTAQLGADVMLMRAYSHPELYQPVFFLIMQSTKPSSFHPPIVCYPALGYTIESEEKEPIVVQNISWAEGRWLQKETPSNATIMVKKLIVYKEAEEDHRITERRLVLYFYVKERPFDPSTITFIRVEALIPTEGSYDGMLAIASQFMGDTIPYMFELRREEPIIFVLLASRSLASKAALALLILIPLLIIFYPHLKAAQRGRSAGER